MEAWHNQFEKSSRERPTCDRLINMFQVEQNATGKKLAEILSGKSYLTLNEKELRIFMMVKRYKRATLDDFLKAS